MLQHFIHALVFKTKLNLDRFRPFHLSRFIFLDIKFDKFSLKKQKFIEQESETSL